MTVPSQVATRFDTWACTFDHRNVPCLDKALVHRHEARNVFVSRVERTGLDTPDDFIGQFAFHPDHTFFFEHPLDHVPGLMLIEGARQFGIATAHLFYDVPFDTSFVLDDVNVRFTNFAELQLPVFALCTVRDKVSRRDRLMGVTFVGHFIQGNETIGSMRAAMKIYDCRVLDRMRRGATPSHASVQS